ncbi:MAG TPA: hypothetical protein VKR06_06055 [Ktedonosporobacter sp.]|nr:hypothetical protein [Ktedonosporobacter sp.]
MPQMNPQQVKGESQDTYGGYEGVSQQNEQGPGSSGQKLDVDGDEQFADILARKIKEELRSEVQSAPLLRARATLAMVSVGAAVLLFGQLVWLISSTTLNTGAAIALGYGVVAVCTVLIVVNVSFNKLATAPREKGTRKDTKKVGDQ